MIMGTLGHWDVQHEEIKAEEVSSHACLCMSWVTDRQAGTQAGSYAGKFIHILVAAGTHMSITAQDPCGRPGRFE